MNYNEKETLKLIEKIENNCLTYLKNFYKIIEKIEDYALTNKYDTAKNLIPSVYNY